MSGPGGPNSVGFVSYVSEPKSGSTEHVLRDTLDGKGSG